jgi:hypothetical protein
MLVSWLGRAALGLLAATLLVGLGWGVIDGRRGYESANVRLIRTDAGDGTAVWRVIFDAEWSAVGDPPIQVQPCTARLLARDGRVLRERGFGLHVGRGDRSLSPPFDFPVSDLPGVPARAEVVCSREG